MTRIRHASDPCNPWFESYGCGYAALRSSASIRGPFSPFRMRLRRGESATHTACKHLTLAVLTLYDAAINRVPLVFARQVIGMSFLRQLFGPSREEVWRQLCAEIDAEYVDGGFWRSGKVLAQVGPWTLTLDTYVVSSGKSSTTFTRMRAPFVNADGFRFTIYRHGYFTELGKLLGMQDVEIGDPAFDAEFVIKGNDENKLRALLANSRLKELMARQPTITLSVQDDEGWFGSTFPEGVDELRFSVVGVIKDVDRLKSLYELFAEALHQLCHIGSAYEDDPQLVL